MYGLDRTEQVNIITINNDGDSQVGHARARGRVGGGPEPHSGLNAKSIENKSSLCGGGRLGGSSVTGEGLSNC